MLKNYFLKYTKLYLDTSYFNSSQTRRMSRVKQRFTVDPFWQPKKTRVLYPEHLTTENEEFIKEKIEEQYSPLNQPIFEPKPYVRGSYRCGLIGKKIGAYPMWTASGKKIITTLLQIPENHVIKYISPEELAVNDIKYKRRVTKKTRPLAALVIGAEAQDPTKCTKEYFNLFTEAGVLPKKRLSKFYITPNAKLLPGTPLHATHFRPGHKIDCSGITVDRGFQGVMVRWGFHGGRATHGVTKSHRRPGNIGSAGEMARVVPGTKLPGHMGRRLRTLRGLTIVRINTKHNILYIHGLGIPGEIGNYVTIFDSILYSNTRKEEDFKDFFPTRNVDDLELEENLFLESMHQFNRPSITFEQEKKTKKRR